MDLFHHAVHELKALGYDVPLTNEDRMAQKLARVEPSVNDIVSESVMALVETAEKLKGHSGASFNEVIDLFSKVAKHQTLAPLTGKEWEWFVHDFDDQMYAQNIRDGRVFQRRDGSCYFIDGRVFYDEPGNVCGCGVTNRNSLVEIESFPYTPETRHFEVDKDGNIIKEIHFK
jgi:hypothetical protein